MIFESLARGTLRVVGTPAVGTEVPSVGTDNVRCQFLTHGQTTRAHEYQKRAEQIILDSGQSDQTMMAVSMFEVMNTDKALSEALRGRITIKLRTYLAIDKATEDQRLFIGKTNELKALVVMSLIEVMPAIKTQAIHKDVIAMFYGRAIRIAIRLWTLIEPYILEFRREDFSFTDRERTLDRIITLAQDEELFKMDETLNMVFLGRVRGQR